MLAAVLLVVKATVVGLNVAYIEWLFRSLGLAGLDKLVSLWVDYQVDNTD